MTAVDSPPSSTRPTPSRSGADEDVYEGDEEFMQVIRDYEEPAPTTVKTEPDTPAVPFTSPASSASPPPSVSPTPSASPVPPAEAASTNHQSNQSEVVLTEFSVCPPKAVMSNCFWVTLNGARPGVFDKSIHLQREVTGVSGANTYAAQSYQDAWNVWREGNLGGEVDWGKDISPHSLFPRILYEEDLPTYLSFIRQLNGGAAEHYTAMAAPVPNLQIAEEMTRCMNRKFAFMASPTTKTHTGDKLVPSSPRTRIDTKGKGMAPLMTDSNVHEAAGTLHQAFDAKKDTAYCEEVSPNTLCVPLSEGGPTKRSLEFIASPRKRVSVETVASESDTSSVRTESFSTISINDGIPSTSSQPNAGTAPTSDDTGLCWAVFAGVKPGIYFNVANAMNAAAHPRGRIMVYPNLTIASQQIAAGYDAGEIEFL